MIFHESYNDQDVEHREEMIGETAYEYDDYAFINLEDDGNGNYTNMGTDYNVNIMMKEEDLSSTLGVETNEGDMLGQTKVRGDMPSNSQRKVIVEANRFRAAQRDRTLRHHRLVQPTISQERDHISSLGGNDHTRLVGAKRMSSSMSLVTLPEFDEGDEEVVLDLSKIQGPSTVISDRSTSSVEDALSLSEMSPTTTLYVPGQEDDLGCNGPPFPKLNTNGVSSSNFAEAYCQPCEIEPHSLSHRFVICADTQFGITKKNASWDIEKEYSVQAVDLINAMDPRPAFVCVCGDLVDMEFSFEKKKGSKSQFPSSLFSGSKGIASREVCDAIQDEQNDDFKKIWSALDPDIALVCLCGNHDIGNRPTPRSISRFRAAYGDEYLAFWSNGTYNIVLNNVLFVDPTAAKRIYNQQLRWLESKLQYAVAHQAENIFVFSHHPWFLYDENEDPGELTGASPCPEEWLADLENDTVPTSFPDSYFSMPMQYRTQALELFREYGVKACFSGHFHQNLVSRTKWGMDMIITAPLSTVFESTGKQKQKADMMLREEHKDFIDCHRGRRRKMTFESEEAMLNCGSDCSEVEGSVEEPNCRGVRVVDVEVGSGFRHVFVPL